MEERTTHGEPGLTIRPDEWVNKRLSVGGYCLESAKARQVPAAQLLLSEEADSQAQCQLFKSSPFDNTDYISIAGALG